MARAQSPLRNDRVRFAFVEPMKNVLAWVLAIFLAALFASAGVAKLINNPVMIQEFARIGFGQWFRHLTGILEVGGAMGMLIPKFRFWAALDIATVMAGATIANLTVLHTDSVASLTAALMVLSLLLAWFGRPAAEGAEEVVHESLSRR
jgi:putative oxidoreductase